MKILLLSLLCLSTIYSQTVGAGLRGDAFSLQPVNERGKLGRNTLIGPGIFNFDFSLAKSFALWEGSHLDFRAETFNLPNHPNFAIPSGITAFTGAGSNGVPTVAANWA